METPKHYRRGVQSPPERGGVFETGGKHPPFGKWVGGSIPPRNSPPLRGGVWAKFGVGGGEWGGVPFSDFQRTPPRSGGDYGGECGRSQNFHLGCSFRSVFTLEIALSALVNTKKIAPQARIYM